MIELRPLATKICGSVLDIVLPVHCIGCGESDAYLCPDCRSSLPPLEPPYCEICADPGVSGVCRDCQGLTASGGLSIQGIRAPFLMEGLVREAIHGFKYRNCRVAAPPLADAMAQFLEKQSQPLPGEVIVPVPIHRKKLRERGYNQAALLASELAKRTGLELEEKLLERTRHSPAQALSGSRQQRRENIHQAFDCRSDASGKNILLVDDVCTTGSTMDACAAALAGAGAKSVWGVALARERLRSNIGTGQGAG